MNKLKLTTFLLLFVFQNGISQTEPREIKFFQYLVDTLNNSLRIIIEQQSSYDFHGNLSSQITKVYDADENSSNWKGEFYNYDKNNLLIKKVERRYNKDVDLWITLGWEDYKYNENGCLVEEKSTTNIGGETWLRIIYTRNSDCQITSSLTELSNGFSGLEPQEYFTRVYYPDGNFYEEDIYNFSSDTSYFVSRGIHSFDANGKILDQLYAYNISSQDIIFGTKVSHEYDENNNIIGVSNFNKNFVTGEWRLYKKRIYENEYDENGFLIKILTEEWNYGGGNPPYENLFYHQQSEYKNSCEGLVEEAYFSRMMPNDEYLNRYVYEGTNQCLDLEKINLQILISPNPSEGDFKITSSIFQTGNTDVLVFSIDGKVLLQTKEISRCKSSSLDLSFLQNGFYFLQLRNGDHFVKEKIVIAK